MTATADDASTPRLDPELAALVDRTRGVQPMRRIFHAANGLLLALLPPALGLPRTFVLTTLAALFVLLFASDVIRLRAPRLNTLFFRTFPALASPREAGGFASSTWYVLGGALTWALFPARLVTPAILVLGLADPAAGWIGRLWGRRRLGAGTLAGSTTFVVVASAVLALWFDFPTAVLAALITAAVECLPWRIDDNLTIPLAAGAGLWLIGP